MATAVMEIYDALREAGASEAKSRAAAESVASNEQRFAKIETDIGILKWMAGFNVALSLSMLGLLLNKFV